MLCSGRSLGEAKFSTTKEKLGIDETHAMHPRKEPSAVLFLALAFQDRENMWFELNTP
jgi:hypothetical protein